MSCGRCPSGSTCQPDQMCASEAAYLCKPLAGCGAGNVCGMMDNGCGGYMSCGKCATGQVCLGNTQCVAKDPICVPKIACDTRVCGAEDDGCGGTLNCEWGQCNGWK